MEKEKYGIGNIKLKSIVEIGEMLNIEKNKFGFRAKKTVLLFGYSQLNGKFIRDQYIWKNNYIL
jgi:hypothetical protein